MKNFYILTVLTFFSLNYLFAQPNLEWDTNWNGPSVDDIGKCIVVDEDGNVYVAAASDGTYGKDYLTIKYSPSGAVLWTQRYNGTGNGDDEPMAIELDEDQNVYVTGKSMGVNTGFDIVTIKYSQTGATFWIKIYNGEMNQDDVSYAMTFYAYGFLYISCYKNDVDKGIVIKYSQSGNLIWAASPGSYYKIFNKILINQFGNVVVSSSTLYSNSFLIYELSPNDGSIIYTYFSFDAFGFVESLSTDKLGNLYVLITAGYSNHPYCIYYVKFKHGYGQDSWNTYTYYNSESNGYLYGKDMKLDQDGNLYALISDFNSINRYLLKKIDNLGNTLWNKTFVSPEGFDEFPVALTLNYENVNPDIYVSGFNSDGNIRLLKYNNDGENLWSQIYDCGSNQLDIANDMTMDECFNLYITGSSSCNGTYKDIKTIKYSTLEKPEINVTGTLPLCQGQEVTLSVPTCTGCTYKWSSGQTTNSITVAPTQTTSYIITVTNSSQCETISLPKEIIVNPLITPDVSIVSNKTMICTGESVTFTASPTGGGNAPMYEWYINGVKKTSGNSNSFTSANLTNGNIITCIMNSNAKCLTTPSATSNAIVIIVNPIVPVSIQISTAKTTICVGVSVTCTAVGTNAGNNPIYKWYVNNQLQNESSSTFTISNLTNGAKINATLTSSEACPNPVTAFSNTLTITVSPMLTPSVSISASSNSICQGQNVTFTATPVNGGQNPVYQWYIGNVLQTETSGVFTTNTLINGNQVFCILLSNEECLALPTATSNFISVAVNPLVTPKLMINASSTQIFTCEQVTFTTTPTYGGNAPQYKWFVNGVLVGNQATLKTTTLIDGAKVFCSMNSNANCVSASTVNSDTLTISVYPLPQPEIIITHDTLIIGNYSGTQYTYAWYYNGTHVSSASHIRCKDNGNGLYYVVVGVNACSVTSATLNVTCSVGTQEFGESNNFIIYPNPTSGILQIAGFDLDRSNYTISIYNILGIKIDGKIINTNLNNINTQMDLSTMNSGTYFIRIESDNFNKIFNIQKL